MSVVELAVRKPSTDETTAVALKAFGRVVAEWGLPIREAAALADMSPSTWKRAREPGHAGGLTRDQLLRLSAVVGIYKALKLYFDDPLATRWPTLPNEGPLFEGARPVDVMVRDGLPQILQVRGYLDALRSGA